MRDKITGWIYYRAFVYKVSVIKTLTHWKTARKFAYDPDDYDRAIDFLERHRVKKKMKELELFTYNYLLRSFLPLKINDLIFQRRMSVVELASVNSGSFYDRIIEKQCRDIEFLEQYRIKDE